jgi:molybdopterin-guanine dinucleotide biosynthesis protein
VHRPFIIAVGGFSSSVGKTTLLCELLRAFPGWEAIKTTRGHYRSCGKDVETCCVSHLLSEEPLVRSGRVETYAEGKDTGRYWDAGAANVHWLIATDDQIEQGIRKTLDRVDSEGVFVEGNSFTRHVRPDYFLMVKRVDSETIKASAKQSLGIVSAVYVSSEHRDDAGDVNIELISSIASELGGRSISVYTRRQLPDLVEALRRITAAPAT